MIKEMWIINVAMAMTNIALQKFESEEQLYQKLNLKRERKIILAHRRTRRLIRVRLLRFVEVGQRNELTLNNRKATKTCLETA